jgi:HD-GYP domain-containing protein (c-di-GMP phosphodiesterase class II)
MIANDTTIEVIVDDLQPGMYVSNLDRPWLGTSYSIQGVLIQSQKDIDALKRYCKRVYVDIDRSEPYIAQRHIPHRLSSAPQDIANLQRVTTYEDICTAEEEMPAATKAHSIVSTLFSDININIERNTKFDIRAAEEVVDTLCESIIRNPDAALLLAQLKTTGKELYDIAIKTSVHLLAFGRHLGLPRKELSLIGLGGLLMDIGKQRLPKEIQTKRSLFLTPNERKLMKAHISYGEQIVTQLSDATEEVIKIVLQHHERENGSGYPHGLHANQLHPYGRMAAIVDCYEELTWGQSNMPGMRPFHALKELRDNAQNGLSYALVEQFAHCIGTFPVGSLVELNTGEVAIVLAHNRTQRFLPHIMIICDAKKKPYDAPLTLDLRLADTNPAGVQYAIVNDLPQGAYGIDAKKYYL